MKSFFIIITFFLINLPLATCQITDIQLLEIAIKQDSLGYFQETGKSEGELYYVKNPIMESSLKEGKKGIDLLGIKLKIIGVLPYRKLKKRKKKSIPIIWIEKFYLKGNILTYNVKGAQFLYSIKEEDLFFVFSDFLISFKYNCNTNGWEQQDIRNISE